VDPAAVRIGDRVALAITDLPGGEFRIPTVRIEAGR
jgi:hypothetical protein